MIQAAKYWRSCQAKQNAGGYDLGKRGLSKSHLQLSRNWQHGAALLCGCQNSHTLVESILSSQQSPKLWILINDDSPSFLNLVADLVQPEIPRRNGCRWICLNTHQNHETGKKPNPFLKPKKKSSKWQLLSERWRMHSIDSCCSYKKEKGDSNRNRGKWEEGEKINTATPFSNSKGEENYRAIRIENPSAAHEKKPE